jgi:hypothetical protein
MNNSFILLFILFRLNSGYVHISYAETGCIGLNLLNNKSSFKITKLNKRK